MRYPRNAFALVFLQTTFAFSFAPNHIFGNLPSHRNAVLHGGCSMQAGSSAEGGPALGQKTALVTGATDGIGLHTATKLANAGYFVLIHGRDPVRIQEALRKIRLSNPKAGVESFQADFSSLRDVSRFASEVLEQYQCLDLLINNAGVFSQQMRTTEDGNEMTFQVNVLAPFLLTKALLPIVAKAQAGRVIIVSSISQSSRIDWDNLQMEKGFSSHESYSLSKLCNAMHALELARATARTAPHVSVNTLDPGTVNTKMLLAGWGYCGMEVADANDEFLLATDPRFEGVSGKYFVGGRERQAAAPCYDAAACAELWRRLEALTDRFLPTSPAAAL
eukprot:CAMPEP_0172159878 /NCGR_PEP_ID=MMETSP1050-20130122/5235_1 /TAXON_ID=233186 /ORGANISM="Cryptomonas curvata, Strain CCAP979/52" /LENGTH=333 /DNA_ID=CAMNT_0012829555 /DNA_START=18 /DNA_END=1019 /DNA_ORIENTATION=-